MADEYDIFGNGMVRFHVTAARWDHAKFWWLYDSTEQSFIPLSAKDQDAPIGRTTDKANGPWLVESNNLFIPPPFYVLARFRCVFKGLPMYEFSVASPVWQFVEATSTSTTTVTDESTGGSATVYPASSISSITSYLLVFGGGIPSTSIAYPSIYRSAETGGGAIWTTWIA